MLLRPTIKLSDSHYLKNPEETELGRNIVGHSILMIEEMGIEQFTFKKLAEKIGSTEASVYRYFENKHQLLLYLISWYWTWLNHRIIHYIEGKSNRQERLEVA
ncbi:MAG: TetR/AcrR family transcriptional regulator, partial [Flavobacteriales bacterium]|nr:TetR/AcrR family transcriptional regulator [Flavobacteriales bacterium]